MSEILPPPGSNPSQPKTSALAISSLILGILGLICFSIFAAIPGVICGHLGLSRIKQSAGALTGKGLAIAGLITGYLGILWAIIFIPLMLAIAIPNFVKARETAQKNSCINNLSQIDSAKQEWSKDKNKGPSDTPTASDLTPYLGGPMPACPSGGIYVIGPVGQAPTCSQPGHKLE